MCWLLLSDVLSKAFVCADLVCDAVVSRDFFALYHKYLHDVVTRAGGAKLCLY